jgi:hypothetical protein
MAENRDPSGRGLRVAEMIKSGDGQTEATERAPGIFESRRIGSSYAVAAGRTG